MPHTLTASWVIIDTWESKVVCETFSKFEADHLIPRYEAVPIAEYLGTVNALIKRYGGTRDGTVEELRESLRAEKPNSGAAQNPNPRAALEAARHE
jgi:hypothetical protein